MMEMWELRGRDDVRFSTFLVAHPHGAAHKGLNSSSSRWGSATRRRIAFSGQSKVPIVKVGDRVVSDSWEDRGLPRARISGSSKPVRRRSRRTTRLFFQSLDRPRNRPEHRPLSDERRSGLCRRGRRAPSARRRSRASSRSRWRSSPPNARRRCSCCADARAGA